MPRRGRSHLGHSRSNSEKASAPGTACSDGGRRGPRAPFQQTHLTTSPPAGRCSLPRSPQIRECCFHERGGALRSRTDRARYFCLCRFAAHTRSASTRPETCISVATQIHRGSPRDAVCADCAYVADRRRRRDAPADRRVSLAALSRSLPSPGQMLAAERKQDSGPRPAPRRECRDQAKAPARRVTGAAVVLLSSRMEREARASSLSVAPVVRSGSATAGGAATALVLATSRHVASTGRFEGCGSSGVTGVWLVM